MAFGKWEADIELRQMDGSGRIVIHEPNVPDRTIWEGAELVAKPELHTA